MIFPYNPKNTKFRMQIIWETKVQCMSDFIKLNNQCSCFVCIWPFFAVSYKRQTLFRIHKIYIKLQQPSRNSYIYNKTTYITVQTFSGVKLSENSIHF